MKGSPDADAVLSICKSTALNLARYAEQTALACGGRVQHWRGVSFCDARSPHRYRNAVVPTESLSREETAEFARRLVDFYGPTRNWTIWAVPELDAEGTPLRNHLSEELMYLSGDNIAGSTVPGLDIVEITDRPGMLHFEEIWARSYGHVHLLNADPQDLFNERVLGQGHRLWLGHMAGRPVATAGSFVHSGINVIRTVSTLPEFQGMGIGTAMTLQAVTASDLPRVLNAEPGAEGLYRRLGFVKIADFRFWSIPSLETQTGAT